MVLERPWRRDRNINQETIHILPTHVLSSILEIAICKIQNHLFESKVPLNYSSPAYDQTMHPVLNLINTLLLLPLFLTTITDAYQINPRSANVVTLACDTRNLFESTPGLFPNWNITSTCITNFQTNCTSSNGQSASVKVPSLGSTSSFSCLSPDFQNIRPVVTAEICACACHCTGGSQTVENPDAQHLQAEEACERNDGSPYVCTNLVQSLSVSTVASATTWSKYTATGSAPASTTTSVKDLGPQEGFERMRRV